MLEEGLQEGRQEEVQEQEQQRREMEVQEEVAAVDESLDISENHGQIEIRFVKSKGNRNLGEIISGNNNFFVIYGSRGKQKTVVLPTTIIVHGNMMERDKDLGQVVKQKQ